MPEWAPSRVLDGTGLAIFGGALAVSAGMMWSRHRAAFWNELPVVGELEPGQHLSNFALSLMLIVGICLFPLLMQARRTVLAVMGAVLVANLVVEAWIPILNTPDPRDAIAGIIGVVAAAACLWTIDRLGTRPTRAPGSAHE